MGIAIKIAGANFTHFVDREVPHIELAAGYFLLGGSLDASKQNLAPNRTIDEATVVGAPDVSAGWLTLNNANYLNTGIEIDTVTGDFTVIAMASVLDSTRQPLCGTYHSGTADMMLDVGAGSQRFTTRGSGAGLGGTGNGTFTYDRINFSAGVKEGSNVSQYLNVGSGMTILSGTAGTGTPASNPYVIGPFGGLEQQDATDLQRHAANLIFPVALTQTQIEDIYDYFVYALAKRGVAL